MSRFKVSYKYKILLYFLVVLIATGLLFSYILVKREQQLKLDRITYQMQPYTDLIYHNIKGNLEREHLESVVDSLGDILPKGLRITILDRSAWVIFDNMSHRDSILDNHLNRPELSEADSLGYGTSLRYSATLGNEYLYYAKKYPELFLRTALEYDTAILPVIRVDKTYQIYIAFVFLLALGVIVYIIRTVNKPYSALKEFINRVQHGDENYDDLELPKDELGEVIEKIVSAFRQQEISKKYKQELTHNVAHELKTPVAGIRGYLETLLGQENIDKEQSRFFLERAYAQTLRLNAIINDMAVLNKIEEAADKFEYEKINVWKCLKEIENDLSYKLVENKIKFVVNVEWELEIEGNYLLIYSLFKNLIDNSIDHAGKGIGIYISQTGISDNMVRFTYYDTGKGVKEEHIGRIFERFYRVEEGRSRKSGGSGLGLSIVKNAVMLHKGTISVKNRYNGGLQFDFSLRINA
jgi:signal transduction histidine kinase